MVSQPGHLEEFSLYSRSQQGDSDSVFNQQANPPLLHSANQQTLRTSQNPRRRSSPVKNLINIFITLKHCCLSHQPHRVTHHKHPHDSSVLSSLPSPQPLLPSVLLAILRRTSNQRPLSFPCRQARIPEPWLQVFFGTDTVVHPQHLYCRCNAHPHPTHHLLHHLPGQCRSLPEPPL